MPETSPSVLVIRLDGIGDALALSPLLAALAASGVPADIVLRPENAEIFSRTAVRRVDVASWQLRSSQPEDDSAMHVLAAELASRGYTHALVATEDPSGYRLARAARISQRIGFENGWGKPFKTLWVRGAMTQTIYRPAGTDSRALHECQVLFELGRGLMAETSPTTSIERLRPLVLDENEPPDPRVAFQVTDKWERLGMPLDAVVAAFREAGRTESILAIASAREHDYVERFEQLSGAHVVRFERTAPWKAAIGRARAVIAPDSGALHVAGTAGTPVVAIFPDDRQFELQTARWRPWASPYRIVRAGAGWPEAATRSLGELLTGKR
ncbi:MAG TPA: glycosyltransferase family 9 protein [Candidatus Tumulicola sp.]|jgi:ADP-heptose:LPS heptosyltransferase